MRTPTIGTAFYAPGEPPSDPKELQNYLREEFQKISTAVTALSLGHLDTTTVAPAKPREGDIRLCSGTGGWDPMGTGFSQFVVYRSSGWFGLFDTSKTVTAAGTTGARTINKSLGTVNFAAAASSLVVTNSLVSTSSIIICTIGTADATMKSVVAVAAAGSFTITANAAATAETRVNFAVFN